MFLRKALRFGDRTNPFLIAVLVVGFPAIDAVMTLQAHAGSGGYTSVPPVPPPAPNQKGPCTDNHTYVNAGGGPGICGQCGPQIWNYPGGSCQGTDPGDVNNCYNVNAIGSVTDNYTNIPVGVLATLACYLLAGIDFGLVSAAAIGCVPAGVVTLGAAMIACLVAAGVITAAIGCLLNACLNTCTFVGSVNGAAKGGCF